MQQTVLYMPIVEAIRKNLEERNPSFTWKIIDENSLSKEDTLYLEGLSKKDLPAKARAAKGRIKRHYTDALSNKITLIIVAVSILDDEFAKKFWDDSTESYNAVNLILTENSFFDIKNKESSNELLEDSVDKSEKKSSKNTFFITSHLLDEFSSFCDIIISDSSTEVRLEEKSPLDFISNLNNEKITNLMLFDKNYSPDEIKHHTFFAASAGTFTKIQIKSSLEDLYELVKKNNIVTAQFDENTTNGASGENKTQLPTQGIAQLKVKGKKTLKERFASLTNLLKDDTEKDSQPKDIERTEAKEEEYDWTTTNAKYKGDRDTFK